MLELLRIQNLALIEDASLEFAPGMNVLTGETGAGKSFILKALNFVTGEKMGTEHVRPGKEKAIVEALFMVNGEELIIRRELVAESGRSRLYVNDHLASQETVRELRPSLLIHTSQHGQQKLLQPSYQAKMLDDYMQLPSLTEAKDRLLKQLHDLIAQRNTLEARVKELEEKRDVFEYQLQEIQKVSPLENEEEALETKREHFRNQAEIRENTATARELLRGDGDSAGLLALLGSIERPLRKLSSTAEEFSPYIDSIMDARSTLEDLDSALQKTAGEANREIDIEAIESRLYQLAQLKRKLKRPLSAILDMGREIEENLSFLDSCQLEKKRILADEEEICVQLANVLEELNEARHNTASVFSNALQKELANLGFSNQAEVFFSFTEQNLHKDYPSLVEARARMLWKPNPGQPPQPLDQIASGGELSRFLLAVVTLMSKMSNEAPTFIFDEVDAGVGGLTLNSVATSLHALASARQMILITHWPQLAAKAQRHFVIKKDVRKGETFTSCTQLPPTAIKAELSRMAGGGEQGDALARKLIQQCEN